MIKSTFIGAFAAAGMAAFSVQAAPLSPDLTQDPSFSLAAYHHCQAGYSYSRGGCHRVGYRHRLPIAHHCQRGFAWNLGGCRRIGFRVSPVHHHCQAGYSWRAGACRRL